MHSTGPHKPHGSFSPQPERGAYILREPKGAPDVLLFAGIERETILIQAANILSVQGITARIVLISDTDLFESQDSAYRQYVFSEMPIVRIGLAAGMEDTLFSYHYATLLPTDTSAAELARITSMAFMTQKDSDR